MDEELEMAFEEIAKALRELQAGQIAQTRVLRALIASHPDPDALWHRYSAPSAAEAATAKVLNPERSPVHAAVADALQAWNERLEADLRKT